MSSVSLLDTTSREFKAYQERILQGASLSRVVAQWTDDLSKSYQIVDESYYQGLSLLKEAKREYYYTNRTGRIKLVMLRLFHGHLATENKKLELWNKTGTGISTELGEYIKKNRRAWLNATSKDALPHREVFGDATIYTTAFGEVFVTINGGKMFNFDTGHVGVPRELYQAHTSISFEDWKQLQEGVADNAESWKGKARRGYLIKHPSEKGLPRSVLVTPEGRIYVLLNQTKKEDRRLGKGGFNQAKLAINFETGIPYAILSSHEKNRRDAVMPEMEVRIIEKLQVNPIPGSISFEERFENVSIKHEKQKSYVVEELLVSDLAGVYSELTTQQKRTVTLQLLEGLRELHQVNIAHRDIKLNNIGLTVDKRVVYLDFNMATDEDEGGVYGNFFQYPPSWLPHFTRSLEDWKKKDIYSLGVSLFRLWTDKVIPPLLRFSKDLDLKARIEQGAELWRDFIHTNLEHADIPPDIKDLIRAMVFEDMGVNLDLSDLYDQVSIS